MRPTAMSAPRTMKRYGAIWTADEGWTAVVRERFRPMTWVFGERTHQCCVDVDYAGGKRERDGQAYVHISLAPQTSRDAAMKHALAWVERYATTGPWTVAQTLEDCFVHWKTLYRTRLDVVDHLFFVCGNGYDWLDGAVVSRSPEDHVMFGQRAEPARESDFEMSLRSIREEMLAAATDPAKHAELRGLFDALRDPRKEHAELPIGPLPDDGASRDFCPISMSYSLIARVPDDVRPDWLAFAHEAACVLRDRCAVTLGKREMFLTDDPQWRAECLGRDARARANQARGGEIAVDLERRFPQLVPAAAP